MVGDIVVVLASHIDTDLRLTHLRSCLQSIRHQSCMPQRMYVSASAADSLCMGLQETLTAARITLDGLGCDLRYTVGNQQLAQFQHFAALFADMAHLDGASTWILCSDDDDLWHPQRVAVYMTAMKDRGPADMYECAISAINRVDLPAGCWPAESQCTLLDSGTSNYFNLCASLNLWRRFLQETPVEDLRGPYADVQLCYWLRTAAAIWQLVEAPPGVWMYLWRQGEDGHEQHISRIERLLTPIVRTFCCRSAAAKALQRLALRMAYRDLRRMGGSKCQVWRSLHQLQRHRGLGTGCWTASISRTS